MIDSGHSNRQSQRTVYFRIAEHTLKLILPVDIDLKLALPTFADFYVKNPFNGQYNMTIRITDADTSLDVGELKTLTNTSIVWEDNFEFAEADKCYVTSVRSKADSRHWMMYSTKDFAHSVINIVREELYSSSILSWLLMVVYGQAILPFQTVMIHASVVEKDGNAFAFLGKSGTGKSTHSRLWIQYHKNTTLLNDDNPVIRICPDGKIRIYGSPWSGKTDCYKNKGLPLLSVVRLKQSLYNEMNWKSGVEGLITVLPSCSSIRWNRVLFDHMTTTLEYIIQQLPIGVLDCLPDRAAAVLCYNEIINKYKIHEI
ncbi:hypothetical protein HMPREF0765_0984 [Sphingobacterium spiritivorum ATCC 33300]|uniref:Phosphoenolpyruvate carboxykinase (ATP) n=1 Tax=Sphingobacterium spiritivorum ATCC 33300 TaxID=525372 RepID=C2FUH8_SPHSI|nr:hypothetical protein [Sphingobacterium spiritivorum]EEI93408.1 hypothetical protein HMPREF0765_0984 [Sphingobacterium spiritivorum ATCC 33300]QQS95895.1 hypothetical protein I6J03_21390 [Sphingobacterium spiritivorum]